jgi:hypothetical protein
MRPLERLVKAFTVWAVALTFFSVFSCPSLLDVCRCCHLIVLSCVLQAWLHADSLCDVYVKFFDEVDPESQWSRQGKVLTVAFFDFSLHVLPVLCLGLPRNAASSLPWALLFCGVWWLACGHQLDQIYLSSLPTQEIWGITIAFCLLHLALHGKERESSLKARS